MCRPGIAVGAELRAQDAVLFPRADAGRVAARARGRPRRRLIRSQGQQQLVAAGTASGIAGLYREGQPRAGAGRPGSQGPPHALRVALHGQSGASVA